MIEYITGKIADLTPTYVIVETTGIGYFLNISLQTYTALQNQAAAKLLVHEAIREDAYTLYGFATEAERSAFQLLLGVSGVGAASARLILSTIPTAELEAIIASGNHEKLKTVKGIGAKTAQRIIVDLRDKIKTTSDTLLLQSASASNELFDEALAAMIMLGFAKPAATKALKAVFNDNPSTTVEQAIKKALSML
jgi:Holliday junction DNA helicase RuvA